MLHVVHALRKGARRMKLRPHTHLHRYRQIAGVLTRHGMGHAVTVLGLGRFTPFHKSTHDQARQQKGDGGPAHLRMALEELGTTFIKLGQVLSTRSDLLPPEYQAELARLQDAAAPVAPEIVQLAVVAELGQPLEAAFASFDLTPLASASIGQVHAATLLDGTEVVVKVRRPGVVEQVEEDLEILQNLAVTASRRWEIAHQYDLPRLAHEYAQTLRDELDYLREARNAETFAANFAHDASIHIPRVYWETTTSRVLTLQRVRGIKINDLAALDAAHIDRPALAQRAAKIILHMIFEDGFFHADPHPGNFFVEADGCIGLIDFGMVGTLDAHTQEQLVDLLTAMSAQDAGRMEAILEELGVARQRIDRVALQRDLDHMLRQYYGRQLAEISISAILTETFSIVRRYHLQLPTDLALLLKTIVMEEGMGVQLDPNFNLTSVLAPYAQRLLLHKYSPLLWAHRLGSASLDAARLGIDLPQQVRRIINDLERGALEIGARPVGLEPYLNQLERIANRIVFGILTAAFVIGLAMLLSVDRPHGFAEWAGVFFALGIAAALLLGIYLAWQVLRSERRRRH
jgi:ubiquinone biosynthesis protein